MSACAICGDEKAAGWLLFNVTLSVWPNGPGMQSDGGTFADLDVCRDCIGTVETFLRDLIASSGRDRDTRSKPPARRPKP